MTYVLDGIKTAMERPHAGSGDNDWIICPCGEFGEKWDYLGPAPQGDTSVLLVFVQNAASLAALRFHYQFCPQARLPGDSG